MLYKLGSINTGYKNKSWSLYKEKTSLKFSNEES